MYGFRVPLIVVSAYTPQGYVDDSIYEFGSILVFIENNFGSFGQSLGLIGPGGYADAYAIDLDNFFTLQHSRPFHSIHALYDENYFLNYSAPPIDPDDDGDDD